MEDIWCNGSWESESIELGCVHLFATPWTIAPQAPLFMEFSRQEYWSGLPFPFPGDLPDPGIESESPALHTDSLLSEPPGKLQCQLYHHSYNKGSSITEIRYVVIFLSVRTAVSINKTLSKSFLKWNFFKNRKISFAIIFQLNNLSGNKQHQKKKKIMTSHLCNFPESISIPQLISEHLSNAYKSYSLPQK